MATQPNFIRPTPVPARDWLASDKRQAPTVRVAYIAGPAVQAADRFMAAQPEGVPERTLEELHVIGLTEGLIATAKELLSPPMYTAFLQWGEAASHFVTRWEDDEEGDVRCEADAHALRAVAGLTAVNMHDLLFKAYLANLEAADCPSFGPFNRSRGEMTGHAVGILLGGLSDDFGRFAPLPALIDDLSSTAWRYSDPKLKAFSVPIGSAITSRFSYARGLDSVEREGRINPVEFSAEYNRFMRGPLIQWQRQYDRCTTAAAELAAYDRDVHTPTFAREDVDEATGNAVQTRYDELVDVMYQELDLRRSGAKQS
jgi:hypothetical protein